MKRIYLGQDKNKGKVELDFDEEKIRFILLVGTTGSGKSIFHNNLYKQLSDNYSSNEIGFVFLDMTMVDFVGWQSNYLIKPVISNAKEAIKMLDELAGIKENKRIIIHIEECDMVYSDRKSLEIALDKIKKLNNVCVVFSTSRVDKTYLGDWIKRFIDLKVVFNVATEDDSYFLTGNNMASHFEGQGERVLIFNNQQILCQSFGDKEVEALRDFKLQDKTV